MSNLDLVIEYSQKLGVVTAEIMSASAISVKEELAEICENSKCPGYGLAPSCPPHVMGPHKFRKVLDGFDFALIFKYDIPTDILFGNERNEILYLLHETASSIKEFSTNTGFSKAMAIAAGSCKQIFCKKFDNCPVLTKTGKCRFVKMACPSMSGLGINFNSITRTLDWDKKEMTPNNEPTSSMAGIVLLGI